MRLGLRRVFLWTGSVAVMAVVTVALALVFAYAALQSESGRAHLAELLARHLSTPGGTQVQIGRIEGDLPARPVIRDVMIGDREGVWLRVAFTGVSWRPTELLSGMLRISKLDVEGMTVLRRPGGGESAGSFRWPDLPLRIAVENFSLENAVLERAVLGERVAFRASGDTAIEGPDRVTTTIALSRTDGIPGHASVEALLRPRTRSIAFRLAIDEPEGGMLARALDLEGLPSVSIDAEGQGPLEAVRGNARLRAGDAAFVESEFSVDASGPPVVDLDGRAQLSRLVDPPMRELLSSDVAFRLQAEFTEGVVRVTRGTLGNAAATVELSGELDGVVLDLDTTADIHDLAPLGEVAGLPLAGRARVRSRIRSDDIRQRGRAFIEATLIEPLAPGNPLQAPLGSTVDVAGTLELDAGLRRLVIRDLLVTGGAGRLHANAEMGTDGADLEGDFRLIVPELGAFAGVVQTPVGGELSILGSIAGSIARPTLSADISSPSISLGAASVGGVEAGVNVTQMIDGIRGDITLGIDDRRFGVAALSSRFSIDAGDMLRLDGLALASRDAKLEGAAVIGLADAALTGRLAGKGLPLAPWSDLVGSNLSGTAGVVLEMRAGKSQRLELRVIADRVRAAHESLAADAVEATVRIEDVLGTPKASLRAVATGARISEARLVSVVVEAKMREWPRVGARLQTHGDFHGPFELETVADYEPRDDGFVVIVSELDAAIGGQDLVLTKPARLGHRNGITELARSSFSVAGGRAAMEGRIDAELIEGDLTLEALSLADLGRAVSIADVTGTLAGRARISGTRRAPLGELELESSDVRSTHTALATAPPASGSLRGDWRDGQFRLNAKLAGITDTSIEAHASVPLRLAPESLALDMPLDEAIEGKLRWKGELGPVWDLLSSYEDRFTGPGELALDLAGTVKNPRVSGYFRIIGGAYENVHSGTTLVDVNLTLVGDGDKLVVDKLTASDGKQGTLEGGGMIAFLPAEDYPTSLHLEFNDMLLVARDDLILNAGGKLALAGTFSSALLSGEIVTGNSELSLAGTLPPQVVELEVREINSADATNAREPPSQSAVEPSVVILDLDLSVPGRAFVRGLGLDSEWQGEVRVSGDAIAPNVAGVLTPVRGHFSLMGKRFRLERGTIRFTGADDVDPLLDLTAEHDASNLKAIVHVTGSASKPKITLTSRPPLPESEIASQVLFGTDSANLTAAQSLQLASAIATYSGKGGAVGVLDATRRALGVDVIGFSESKENPDTTRVSVGKYVTEGVYLEVEAGAEESSRTTTTVEVEVLPDVRIEGGTTEKGGNKVGVKWKWDY